MPTPLIPWPLLVTLLAQSPSAESTPTLPLVRSHLDTRIQNGQDHYGPTATPMWVASLDLATLQYPVNQPKAAAGQRVYRHIDAPWGSTLAWDLPELTAAHRVSQITGEPSYAWAADAYVEAYLNACTGSNGLLAWGNHFFYDCFLDTPVGFGYGGLNDPAPLPPSDRGYHELRPGTPDWELLWRVDPVTTEAQIRAMAEHHLVGGLSSTGEFDRHANVSGAARSEYSFLEAGGVLAESFAWLHAKRGDPAMLALADRVSAFSFGSRDPLTGILPNQASTPRWDRDVGTSEIGIWAGALARASELAAGQAGLLPRAEEAALAWLEAGWDPTRTRYYGKVNILDGSPSFSNTTIYQPGDYSRPWNAFFPTHDYGIALADACLQLFHRTGDPRFEEAVRRWGRILMEERPALTAGNGYGSYAELYGRGIAFLHEAGETLDDPELRLAARRLAHEAVAVLWDGRMFRGHGGEDRHDAVDGTGWLLQALLDLEEVPVPAGSVTLAAFDFGTAGGAFTPAPSQSHPGTLVTSMTAGPGVVMQSSVRGNPPPSLGVRGDDAMESSPEAALAAGDWCGFVLTPGTGHHVSFHELRFDFQRSAGSDAPARIAVRSSADGFGSNLVLDFPADDEFRTAFVSLVGEPFQSVHQALEIRFLFLEGSGGRYARIDNVELRGKVRQLGRLSPTLR